VCQYDKVQARLVQGTDVVDVVQDVFLSESSSQSVHSNSDVSDVSATFENRKLSAKK